MTLTTPFHYTDQSIRANDEEAGEATLTMAKTDDLLEASRQEEGKILNALDFPMVLASLSPPPPFSTDLLAWRATDCSGGTGIPTGDIRWGLAATTGARTWFHLDSNGFALDLTPKCGEKVFIVIRDEKENFRNINVFKDFELDDAKDYRLEAVLLTPGTRWYVFHAITISQSYSENLKGNETLHPSRCNHAKTQHLSRRTLFVHFDDARHIQRHSP